MTTWYAFDPVDGWYTGPVPADTPNATPIEPPVLETDHKPGAPRSVWARVAWYVVAVPVPPDIDLYAADRAARWAAVKAERDRRKAGGTLVAGKWFHSDADSRVQQLGLVVMGAAVPATPWKTMDGSFVPLTPTLVQQIFAARVAADIALHARGEELKAVLYSAADPRTVDITSGWLSIYGE